MIMNTSYSLVMAAITSVGLVVDISITGFSISELHKTTTEVYSKPDRYRSITKDRYQSNW